MAMPWPQARDFLDAAARLERERLMQSAVAARAAQADAKGWTQWLKEVSGGNGR
jgi:hypothetical protein